MYHRMTRFLTLLAVTCFALVVWGQQPALVGLPEFGVDLDGTVQDFTIRSGRTIIGYVLCLEHAALGGCEYERHLKTRELRQSPPSSGGRDLPRRTMINGVLLDERTLVRVV